MNSLVLGVILGWGLAFGFGHKKPAPTAQPVTFHNVYFEQLDRANEALKLYANTPCDSPELTAVETKLHEEYDTLKLLVKNIPTSESDDDTAHEVEAFLGFNKILANALQNCEVPETTDKPNGNSNT